jgi:lysophospholipase L1-like esterase
MIYLFQGDSVTDCGWNRGVSGNRVKDLAARWEEDCLRLKPKLLTILIGINDCL